MGLDLVAVLLPFVGSALAGFGPMAFLKLFLRDADAA
jgi:hypothetical protein